MDADMWMLYEDFVKERHRIWERRQAGEPGPWTKDQILSSRKFTNVFRVLDPGSQFVLTDLYGDDPGMEDALASVLLYRHTNHPEVWRRLREDFGRLPGYWDIVDDYVDVAAILDGYKDEGMPVFNPAYLIYPGNVKGFNKALAIVLRVKNALERHDDYPEDTLKDQVHNLRSCPGIGDFIAMQVATDIGYHREAYGGWNRENTYILPGPGAVKGAKYLNPGVDPVTTILDAQTLLWDMDDCPTLLGRRPSLMDVQNTLCEFSKLVRYLGVPPGRAYAPAHPGKQEPPVLPQHWGMKGTNQ